MTRTQGGAHQPVGAPRRQREVSGSGFPCRPESISNGFQFVLSTSTGLEQVEAPPSRRCCRSGVVDLGLLAAQQRIHHAGRDAGQFTGVLVDGGGLLTLQDGLDRRNLGIPAGDHRAGLLGGAVAHALSEEMTPTASESLGASTAWIFSVP